MFGCTGSLLPCVGFLGCGMGAALMQCAGFSLQRLPWFRSAGSGALRLSSRGAGAWLSHGTWGLPGAGMGPMSPASAGGLPTSGPPQKPCSGFYFTLTFFPSPVASETEPSSQMFACPLRSFYLKNKLAVYVYCQFFSCPFV